MPKVLCFLLILMTTILNTAYRQMYNLLHSRKLHAESTVLSLDPNDNNSQHSYNLLHSRKLHAENTGQCTRSSTALNTRGRSLPFCFHLIPADNNLRYISIALKGTEFAFPLLSIWKPVLWMHTFCLRLCKFQSGTGLREGGSSKGVLGAGTMATPVFQRERRSFVKVPVGSGEK
jgi:hypothetical protein